MNSTNNEIEKENESYVKAQYSKCEQIINAALEKKDYEKALAGISVCSNLLYEWNQEYTDDFLEDAISEIAEATKTSEITDLKPGAEQKILFYDNFGLDTRGLALIYIKALAASKKKFIYLTVDRANNRQNEIDKVLNSCPDSRKIYFSAKNNYLEKIKELQNVIEKYRPSKAFFYTTPDDSAGTTVFMQLSGKVTRYQINLTDHAFWLGRNAFDYCIEFRDYGASVSLNYRKISKEEIIELPYYPVINKDTQFQGFPFDFTGKKILFSGGSLYKTIDENKTYYHIVSSILKDNNDTCFLYAGSGDDRYLKELQAKYKDRVFHIAERTDLFQLMQHIDLYLNTYPMIGGLMTQYAVVAGKIPLTLKHDLDGSGILIGQEKRKYEYDSVDGLVKDANRLLQDKEYLKRREELLKGSLISEAEFNRQVLNLLENNKTNFNITISNIDTTDFQKDYKLRFSKKNFESAIANRRNLSLALDYPDNFVRKIFGGGKKTVHLIAEKIKNMKPVF